MVLLVHLYLDVLHRRNAQTLHGCPSRKTRLRKGCFLYRFQGNQGRYCTSSSSSCKNISRLLFNQPVFLSKQITLFLTLNLESTRNPPFSCAFTAVLCDRSHPADVFPNCSCRFSEGRLSPKGHFHIYPMDLVVKVCLFFIIWFVHLFRFGGLSYSFYWRSEHHRDRDAKKLHQNHR